MATSSPIQGRSGVILLGLSKILAQAAPILLLAWFSKRVTPETLGLLSFITASLSVLALLSDLGLSDAQNRYLHDSPSLLAPLVNREWALAAAAGILVWLSDLFTGWAAHRGALLGLAVFFSAFYVLAAGFSGLYRLKTAAGFHAGSAIAFMAAAALLGETSLGAVDAILWARLGTWALFDLVLMAMLRGEGRWNLSWKIPDPVRRFALSAFWFNAVELAINQADVALVRGFLGDRAAGIFKTASLLGMAPMALGTLVASALLPVLVRLHASSPPSARRLVGTLSAALAGLLLVGTILGAVTGRFILERFYTAVIAQEGFAVFLLSLAATACYVVAMPVQEWLLATDQPDFVRRVATMRAVLFFPLAAWWGSLWGIAGVSAAHLAIYASFLVIYLLRFLSISPWRPANT